MSQFRSDNIRAVTLAPSAPTVGVIDETAVRALDPYVLALGGDGPTGNAQRNPRVIFGYAADEADNQARTMTVYGLRRMRDGAEMAGAEVVKLWTLSWTLGTATGDADLNHLPSTMRLADTVTETSQDAYLTFLTSLLSTAAALHSPADNTLAHAGISDLGNLQGLIFYVASIGAGYTGKVLAEVYR